MKTAYLVLGVAACVVWALNAHCAVRKSSLEDAVASLRTTESALLSLADSFTEQLTERRGKLKNLRQELTRLKTEESALRSKLSRYLEVVREAKGLQEDMERLRRLVEGRK